MSTLDEINKKLKEANNIVIVTHENPDGDAMGSSLSLYGVLTGLGKNVDVIIPKYAKCFKFLPNSDKIISESDKKYDLAISVDCAQTALLSYWLKYFEEADFRIVIDHHSTNGMFGDLNYVDYRSPACCQVIYNILEYFKYDISKDVGTCLMCGIITDTGSFQYEGVGRDTFEIAANLMTKGVNIAMICKNALCTKTKSSMELKKIALNRMEFLDDDKVTFTYITQEDEKNVGATTGDYEGIVNEGRNVEGVEVSIFLHQKEDGVFKASLRSNEYVDVSEVCLMLGGGGHKRAAGANMDGLDVKKMKNKILKEVERQLK